MGALTYTLSNAPGGELRAILTGVMDEATDLSDLLEKVDRDLVLDLSGIERINSMGVRRWIQAMAALTSEHRVVIEACSSPIAFQANVVSNFFGKAKIRSCLAPYFCSSCNEELSLLVTVKEVHEARDVAPDKACPKCGGTTEFDELDHFLQFMRLEDGAFD